MTDEKHFRETVSVNGRLFKLYKRPGGRWWARAGWADEGIIATGANDRNQLMDWLEKWKPA